MGHPYKILPDDRKSPVWRANEDLLRTVPASMSDSRPSRLPRALLPAVMVALLVVRLLWVVTTNVVNMPYGDEWYVWSDLLEALDNQSLSWSVLVSPYNGHRLAFIRLVLLALLPTGWNVYPQVILTMLITATLFGACWYQYRRTARELRVEIDPWVAVGLGAFVFSCADINLLWGMGLVWYAVVLGSTLCLMLLSARPFRWWRLLLAALCAAAASFSVASGLLAWILGIPTLWIAASHARARTRATICWSAAAAAFCSLYLRNLAAGPGVTPKWGYVLDHLLEVIGFVMTFVGVPIQPRYDATLIFWPGAAAIALWAIGGILLWRSRRADLVPFVPWLAMAALTVTSGILIAAARVGSIPVTPYYVTLARLFWISSAAAFWLILARPQGAPASDRSSRTWLLISVLAVLGVELRQHDFASQTWRGPRESMIQMSYDVPDVCSGNWETSGRVTTPPGALRVRYPVFARHQLSFIHQTRLDGLRVMESAPSSVGEVERATVEAQSPDMGPPCVRLSGWAIDPESREPASEVLLVQENSVLKHGAVTRDSSEVAARLGNPAVGRSGWVLFVSATRWPSNPSQLKVYAVSRDGRTAYALDASHAGPLPSGDVARSREYVLGGVVKLTEPEPDGVDQLRGFSGPEAAGRWTDGKEASIRLPLKSPATGTLTLTATVAAFVIPQHSKQAVDILVNGNPVGHWEFHFGEQWSERQIVIPDSVANGARQLLITFLLPDAAMPDALKFNPDRRMLGISVAQIRVSASTK
jgi:hypothetical protein